MKKICCINGSASSDGANYKLLKAISELFSEEYNFDFFNNLNEMPLFTPQTLPNDVVSSFQSVLTKSDAVIICTPEYAHNIPAVLKNALEWITTSGELNEKPVLPITFTPNTPRGEYAMKSLIPTLKALNARVVLDLQLYQNEQVLTESKVELNTNTFMLLKESLTWL
jgi:chromate reductase